ncbi:MAG: glycine--tRNA ligase subunit beta, partial [Janthinobacterium lividum]
MKTHELILELYSEEIPALMQKSAEESYFKIFSKTLQDHELSFDKIEVLSSAMRVTIHITGLAELIKAKEVEIKGPKIDAVASTIEGFCKSHNIDASILSKKLINKQYFYVYSKSVPQVETKNLLKEILPTTISKHIWPKTMRWGKYDVAWVRPLKNILCLFNGQTLPIKFAHLVANNITYGHRFISPKEIQIDSWKNYLDLLRKNYVIVDRVERQNMITEQLAKIAADHNLEIKNDKQLLEEVCGLVEFPKSVIGKISEEFITLPSEILSASMRTHQKYFSLLSKDDKFAARFLFVSNSDETDMSAILNGNERVLSARLSDALFFYNQDLSVTLESGLQKIGKIIFHAKLGNLKDKTGRIVNICKYLSPGNQLLLKAASLCKSDLASQVVNEFPELQGIMGYYYALNDGLDYEIAKTIRDHYKPMGPLDDVPIKTAALLSIADKIDSLAGLISAGEQLSGSRDPYALRRLALGIIRTILENKLEISIKGLINCALANYQSLLSEKVTSFIEERIKFNFKNEYDVSLINCLLDLRVQDNIVETQYNLHILKEFLATNNGKNLLAVYKRVKNIVVAEISEEKVDIGYLFIPCERELYKVWEKAKESIKNQSKDFLTSLNELLRLLAPIEEF